MENITYEVPLGINPGDVFSSAEEMTTKITQLSQENSVQLYKRDSRTIETAIRKNIKRYIDPKLKFYQVKYACIYGGINYKCKGTGQRNKKTRKQFCPAHIIITVSPCGEKLVVKHVSNIHNHDVSLRPSEPVVESDMEVVETVLCRGCSKSENNMYDLFKSMDNDEISLVHILENTTSVKIDHKSTKAYYMCHKCVKTVVDFYNFKKIFIQNENTLRLLIEKMPKNKDNHTVVELDVETDEANAGNEEQLAMTVEVKTEQNTNESEPDCAADLLEEESQNHPQPSDTDTDSDSNSTTPTPSNKSKKHHIKYLCRICKSRYSQLVTIQRHLFRAHQISKNWKELINKVQMKHGPKALRKVVTANKEGDSMFNCLKCRQQFSSQIELKTHSRTHKDFICEHCGAAFHRKTDLNDHKAVHDPSIRYVCTFCGKKLKTRSAFAVHKRIHTHPLSHVCDACGQRFNGANTLKTHKFLKHTADNRIYKCEICGLAFALKATLSKHNVRKHGSRERTFECEICTARYFDRFNLKRHVMMKHDKTWPLPTCTICQKQYTSKRHLRTHMTRYHRREFEHVLIKDEFD